MIRRNTKFLLVIFIIITNILFLNIVLNPFGYAQSPSVAGQKKQITLTLLLNDLGQPGRWGLLFEPALQELKAKHPDIDIRVKYIEFPYEQTRSHLLSAMSNQTPVDIISLDEIWLGEFAQKGYVIDLSGYAKNWGRLPDWYAQNIDGMTYKGGIYGIWVWTAVRGMWYWKDMLNQAGLDPNSLKTWDGYITAAKKLNAVLRPRGIEGVHLTGANHSPDLWYPYLWMLGGSILEERQGHPTKGTYWFPAYNSSAGVRAMEFIKAQINAGIKPQKQHFWGKEFLDRKFAVMLEAVQHQVHLNNTEQKQAFEQKIGFLPFPVPDEQHYQSSTLMGGWLFNIPKTSKNKDLAWELITLAVEPKILTPWLAKYNYLPTQTTIGNGPFSNILNQSIPYYNQLISMIPAAGIRPSIPEYPQIAEHVRQALDDVYYGRKEPKQALDDAAAQSAKVLGW
jgi:multiple sugar transport system substrate-binding protein